MLAAVQEPIAAANIVARAVRGEIPGAARAAARGRRRRRRCRAVHQGREGRRRRRSRRSTTRTWRLSRRRSRRKIEYLLLTQDALLARSQRRRRGREEAVRRRTQAIHDSRGAQRLAHPHSRRSPTPATPTRRRRRSRPRTFSPRRGPIRRSSPTWRGEFSKDPGSAQQGGDLGSFARGTMVEAVRGCGVRREARRHRRSGADRFRLAHHQGERRQAGACAAVRRRQGADRDGIEAPAGSAEIRRGGGSVPEPGLRAGG